MTQVDTSGNTASMTDSVLDNPAWHSLIGAHARLAEGSGGARRYPTDVSPFAALIDEPGAQAWNDLAAIAGPGASVVVTGSAVPPQHWDVIAQGEGVQLVGADVDARADDEAVRLTVADVPEMVALVELTNPGPFAPRTIELGRYLGIRRKGQLIAMAGERLQPAGYTEISAVCTHSDYRNQGLAGRLVLAVAAGIQARGDTPIMHAAATNTNAIRLYETLGFTLRRHTLFGAYRVPENFH